MQRCSHTKMNEAVLDQRSDSGFLPWISEKWMHPGLRVVPDGLVVRAGFAWDTLLHRCQVYDPEMVRNTCAGCRPDKLLHFHA